MRITIAHSDPAHPNAAPFAFRMGRIREDIDVVTGEVRRTADQLLDELKAEAEKEYPTAEGYVHTIEQYVESGETGGFQPVEPAPAPTATPEG